MDMPKYIVNSQDRSRLLSAIETARRSWRTYGPHLDWLANQLNKALACEPANVPADVVTMNSRVEVEDLRTGTKRTLQLVYPDEQTGDSEQVSIFEPRGLALFGKRVGDTLGWNDADRSRVARVGRLCYQPEAARDLNR